MGGRGSSFKNNSKLTKNERGALIKYFSSDSYKINEKLYLNNQLSSNDKQFVKNLDSALNKMPFVDNKKVVRDLIFPFKWQREEYIKNLNVGSTIKSLSYWSATTDDFYHEIPDIRFIIKHSNKARDMSKIERKNEHEVIYERGARFKIVSKNTRQMTNSHDIIIVELEEL